MSSEYHLFYLGMGNSMAFHSTIRAGSFGEAIERAQSITNHQPYGSLTNATWFVFHGHHFRTVNGKVVGDRPADDS